MKTHHLLIIISIFCFACNEKNNPDTPQEKSFSIETLLVSSTINLSDRSNWNFHLGGNEYIYQIKDTLITATPKDKPYRLIYNVDNNGAIIPITDVPLVSLFSEDYYYPTGCSECPPKPNIKDQSTAIKLNNADMLYGAFSGMPSSNLSGIRLIHVNALLDFDVQNLPAGSTVTVSGFEPITPLQDATDHYKAIVLPSTIGTAIVNIKTTDSTYRVEVTNSKIREYVEPDKHYTFTVRFSQDTKEVVIENSIVTKWSDE
jgi:hypothetical protein